MQHKIVCPRSSAAAALKEPTAPQEFKPPVAVKAAQFVLMEEGEYQQEREPVQKLHCKSCRIKYATVGEWQAHIQEMHLDELACEFCPASFKDESRLSKHIIVAHKVRYPCLVCNTEFTNKKTFLSHMLQEHKVHFLVFAVVHC